MQRSAVQCSAVQCSAVQCSAVLCSTVPIDVCRTLICLWVKERRENVAKNRLVKGEAEHQSGGCGWVGVKVPDLLQEYLTSEIFSNQKCSIIFALKSKTLRGVKSNFKSVNPDNYLCPLCQRHPDTQQHVLLSRCKILQDILPYISLIDYSGLFGNLHKQKEFMEKYEN